MAEKIARRLDRVAPAERTAGIRYAVRDIVLIAEEAKKAGKKLLYLNIGDPLKFDFQTPAHLIEAVYQAMKAGYNGYSASQGIEEALESVRKEAHRKGIRSIQDIFISTGASEAIELCLTALANRGENVLIPFPGYPLYSAVLAKIQVEQRPYYLSEEDGWQPDPEDIAGRIDKRTRAIVLIHPNNPTGALYRREVLEEILALARKHHLVVFSDEIYDKLVFDGKEHISTASLDDEHPIITFNGLSKSYMGPGWRIGWCIASGKRERMKEYVEGVQRMVRARLCANHPLQFAIKPALEGPQDHLKDAVRKLQERRDITHALLNGIRGISCVKPEGAFYAFPRIQVDIPDEEFVQELILETGVVVVHGSGFGQRRGTRHFRVVFLPSPEILERAYGRIGDFIKKYV